MKLPDKAQQLSGGRLCFDRWHSRQCYRHRPARLHHLAHLRPARRREQPRATQILDHPEALHSGIYGDVARRYLWGTEDMKNVWLDVWLNGDDAIAIAMKRFLATRIH